MKNLIFLLVLLLAVLPGGCLEMTTPAAVQTANNNVQKWTESVDAYQKIVVDAFDQAKKDKIVSEETAGKVDKINLKIDELQPIITKSVTAVIETEYSGNKFRDAVTGVQKVNEKMADINPYAPIIDLGCKLLLAFTAPTAAAGIYLAKTKGAEAKDEKEKNVDLEKGINRVKGEADPKLAKKIHDTIKIYTG